MKISRKITTLMIRDQMTVMILDRTRTTTSPCSRMKLRRSAREDSKAEAAERDEPLSANNELERAYLGYAAGRAPPIREQAFGTPYGEIRFNTAGEYLIAHCAVHEKCHRQRTTRASDGETPIMLGQGRPIGALVAWLQSI